MADHYLDDETYNRLIEAIAELEPEIIGDRLGLDPDRLKWLLGEIGGIWPASITPEDRD